MTARPVVSDAAERLYDRLRPYHDGDDEGGWVLLHKCEAAARILARPNQALRHDDTGSGARRMLDPDRAPAWALPWLAQFAGIPYLPAELTEAQRRDLIAHAPGMRRGTPAALIAAVQQVLTGTRTVRLVERHEGDAYNVLVITLGSETAGLFPGEAFPSASTLPGPGANVLAPILSQKPAGLRITHLINPQPVIDEATLAIDDVDPAVTIDNVQPGDV